MKLSFVAPFHFKLLAVVSVLFLGACAGPNSNRTSVLSQISVGEKMLSYGDYDKAYALLDKVAENNPSSSVTALGLGEAYFRQQVLLKASAYYGKAIELGARKEGKLGLARVELARNNPSEAKALLREVLRMEPQNPDALNAMGVVLDLEGDHERAQQLYKSVLARTPWNREALNNLSLSLTLDGNAREAYPFIAELSRSNQNDAVIRQNLAVIQYLAGDRGRAMRTAVLDLTEDEARENFAQISRQ